MGKNAEILNFALPGDRTLGVTLKPHAFNLFEKPQENLWTFDLEGRLLGMYVDGVNYRRTLDNRYFRKSRIRMHGEDFRQVIEISQDKSALLLDRSRELLASVADQLPLNFENIAERVLTTDMSVLEKDAAVFRDIYLPISILPPDQYMALVLQVSEGCNYNQCTFCNFYRDRTFRIKSQVEVEEHLLAVRDFFGAGIKLRRSVFLADANALVIPQNRLVAILDTIHREFPEVPQIYSFIDVFTGVRKGSADFARLAELGLRRVYLGLESGNPALLELLGKPQLSDDIIQLGKDLKAGGVQLGVILLAGAGGEQFRRAHLKDSIALIEKLDLGFGDMIYISEFYETNREYRKVMEREQIELPEPGTIRKISNELRFELRRKIHKDVSISVYDIQQFFY
ncbi:MAG: radical SAM protein [FCB group bacterium]|nr:radical SAM protein [FCB group bacterium]